jgi:hypothetical protein
MVGLVRWHLPQQFPQPRTVAIPAVWRRTDHVVRACEARSCSSDSLPAGFVMGQSSTSAARDLIDGHCVTESVDARGLLVSKSGPTCICHMHSLAHSRSCAEKYYPVEEWSSILPSDLSPPRRFRCTDSTETIPPPSGFRLPAPYLHTSPNSAPCGNVRNDEGNTATRLLKILYLSLDFQGSYGMAMREGCAGAASLGAANEREQLATNQVVPHLPPSCHPPLPWTNPVSNSGVWRPGLSRRDGGIHILNCMGTSTMRTY